MSPAVPSGVYYSRWVSDCLGETIKVITLFMRTDFQSGKCSRVTFLLSTIQPFKCWVIIAAHLRRLFTFSLSRCTLSILGPFFVTLRDLGSWKTENKSCWSIMSFPSGKGRLNFKQSQTEKWSFFLRFFTCTRSGDFHVELLRCTFIVFSPSVAKWHKKMIKESRNVIPHKQKKRNKCLESDKPYRVVSLSLSSFQYMYPHTYCTCAHAHTYTHVHSHALQHFSAPLFIFIKTLQMRSWAQLIIPQPSCTALILITKPTKLQGLLSDNFFILGVLVLAFHV